MWIIQVTAVMLAQFTEYLLLFFTQTPFTLTLRLWDIYILEGEKILTAMAYTILKLHKSEDPLSFSD